MQVFETAAEAADGLRRAGAVALQADSRCVRPGDAFVAWPGAATDARRFVVDALRAGAVAALVEREGVEAFGFDDPRVVAVQGLKALAGPIASAFHGEPSAELAVVAITGTNGKTSSAWWTAGLLSALGWPCGMVGTLGIGRPGIGRLQGTGLTTPDPLTFQAALRGMVDQGLRACAVEASSIGLVEERLTATQVKVAVFTNFTQDHLDYHGDMQAYWAAKARLFDMPGLRSAVINLDDAQGPRLLEVLSRRGLDLWPVALSARVGARLWAADIEATTTGQRLWVHEAGTDSMEPQAQAVELCQPGRHNVANLLGVLAVARALGVPLAQAVQACASLSPVPGRLEPVAAADGLPLVLVDYAHTPDALDQVLAAVRPLAARRGGQIGVVAGCGGDRDPGKRAPMGAAAERGAHWVVLTSDNPRREDPQRILAQMQAGLRQPQRAWVEPDRARAIAHAVQTAAPADVVLIAGKGHEDYQEIEGVRRPFRDHDHALAALQARTPQAPVTEAGMPGLMPLLAALPGARRVPPLPAQVLRVHSDTRSLRAGDLFVALAGERFDAHTFLPQARAAGAVAALAQHGLVDAGLPGVEVPDTLAALGWLARAWRQRWAGPLAAVTGSNGKTTVTQMVATILRASVGEAAHATAGNLNNHIGVPLTLLRLRPSHRLGVVELGMNHPGEIAALADLVRPDVALVNNAQREHQEFMASVEAVARENGAVLDALPPQGVAVFPSDDVHTPLWRERAGSRPVWTFSDADPQADVRPAGQASWSKGVWTLEVDTPLGRFDLRLAVAGRHNLRNALAATACALALGVPLAHVAVGLSAFEPVAGRSRVLSLTWHDGHEMTLVDDTYNANPDSVRAAIDVLAEWPSPRLLILGDMGEVGTQSRAFHMEVLQHARARGIDNVHTLGEAMGDAVATLRADGEQAPTHWPAVEPLLAHVASLRQAGPLPRSVLVKGSRFMRMERVVQALQATAHAPAVTEEAVHAA